LGVFIFLTF